MDRWSIADRCGSGAYFPPERLTRDPEDTGGLALVADPFHDPQDVASLEVVERLQLVDAGQRRRGGHGEGRGQIGRLDPLRASEQDQTLDEVLQLAHVAWPGIPQEQTLRRRSEAVDRLVERGVVFGQEVAGQGQDVFPPLAQRQDRYRDDVQAVEEV